MTEDSSAFILEHGVATRAPIVYKNLNISAAKAIGVSLGDMSTTVQGPGTEMVAFQWATLTAADQNIEDRISLRYLDAPLAPLGVRGHGWWALDHNLSFYRHMIRFLTASANARLFAPWFVNGIFLGQDDLGPPKVSFTAAPNIPDSQDGVDPRTYEKGDVVWNSEPSPGGPIGQVCITSGTQGTLNPVTFSAFGEVVNIGKSISYAESQALGIADRYVMVTVTGKTMTLPASPVDGQTHAIKSRALVTTTVDTAVDAAGGVLTIDGALTTTVAPLQNRTFQYSAATGEWEIC